LRNLVLVESINRSEKARWRMDASPEKCTRQPVRIAARNVKFHSSLILADLFTAEIAGLRDDNQDQEDIRKSLGLTNNF